MRRQVGSFLSWNCQDTDVFAGLGIRYAGRLHTARRKSHTHLNSHCDVFVFWSAMCWQLSWKDTFFPIHASLSDCPVDVLLRTAHASLSVQSASHAEKTANHLTPKSTCRIFKVKLSKKKKLNFLPCVASIDHHLDNTVV